MAKQIFATGTSGTIGSRLPKYVTPVAFNLLTSKEAPTKLPRMTGSALIHLSGIVGNKAVADNPNAYEVNVEGAVRLAQSCSSQGLNRFVYVSTGHVYGAQIERATEKSPLAPFSEYGRQKMIAEARVTEALSGSETELVIVRLFSILGDRMPLESLGGKALHASWNRDAGPIPFSDDIRSFLSIDVAAAHLVSIAELRNCEDAINLCSTVPTSVGQAVTELAISQRVPIPALEAGVSEFPILCGDNSLLRRLYRDHYFDDASQLQSLLESLHKLEFREVGF